MKAKQIADATRKASSEAAIYSFVALLIGAFIVSASAALAINYHSHAEPAEALAAYRAVPLLPRGHRHLPPPEQRKSPSGK